ncbi:MAG: c-type cytochrome biogenesis protein CcmI [Burkholderiales bacterium]|jgi:cytochrome c-type biogenesis protein CcmH|nr:c-type cytochrome biogenesis protein CcmI [Burkholderiales bacterium]
MTPFAFYLFFVTGILMLILTLVWIGPRLFTTPSIEQGIDEDVSNLIVYQDELSQLTDDFALGRLSEKNYEEAKAELNRRLLSEVENDKTIQTQSLHYELSASKRKIGWVVMGLVPILAISLYLKVGNIQTFEVMDSDDHDQYTMVQSLQTHLAANPNDARAWVFLARTEMEANHFSEASAAFEKAIVASPKVANDPIVLCELAEAIGMQQGGVFRGRPQELVNRAVELAPDNPMVLEMAGSAAYEARNYAAAAQYWKTLLAMLNPQSRSYQELSLAILRAEAEILDTSQPLTEKPDSTGVVMTLSTP